MKTIEYRVTYNGVIVTGVGISDFSTDEPSTEIVRIQARNINSGFAKAVKAAREPLGNGHVREIASVEFWAIP